MDTLLLILAFLPAVILLVKVYERDRLNKEPGRLLFKLVIFGALCCIPAALMEDYAMEQLPWRMDRTVRALVENFLIVAGAEELCKYLALRLFTWRRKEFDCSFDGLVYAVYVSLGFAILEDALYISSFGLLTGLTRAVTALPGHAFFGVFMGIYYGEAKAAHYAGKRGTQLKYSLLALLVPILAHGAYDFLATVADEITVIPFFALLAGLYFFGSRGIQRSSLADRFIRPTGSGMQPEPRVASASVPSAGQPLPNWACPVCGQHNDGLYCTFCNWKRPKDGIFVVTRDVKVPPDPSDSPLPLRNSAWLKQQRRKAAPLLIFAAVLPFAATPVVMAISAGLDDMAVAMMLAFYAAAYLLIYAAGRMLRLQSRAREMDPETTVIRSEYRVQEALRRSEYSRAQEAHRRYLDYMIASRDAQKKLTAGRLPARNLILPPPSETWSCPVCGQRNVGAFCGFCLLERPKAGQPLPPEDAAVPADTTPAFIPEVPGRKALRIALWTLSILLNLYFILGITRAFPYDTTGEIAVIAGFAGTIGVPILSAFLHRRLKARALEQDEAYAYACRTAQGVLDRRREANRAAEEKRVRHLEFQRAQAFAAQRMQAGERPDL